MLHASMLAATALVVLLAPAQAGEFLVDHSSNYAVAFQAEIQNAADVALGCGQPAAEGRVLAIRSAALPIWTTLPKNVHGRIDQRSLRYFTHRYFMQTSSISIRGMEKAPPIEGDSPWAAAEILSQQVPAFVESVLESRHAAVNGFGLDDAVTMALMLEQLVIDSDTALLEKIYTEKRFSVREDLDARQLLLVFRAYALQWLLAGSYNPDLLAQVQRSRALLLRALPEWPVVESYLHGMMLAFDVARWQSPRAAPNAAVLLTRRYTFLDVREMLRTITTNIHHIMDQECTEMNVALNALDSYGTGRVPLAKFYHSGEGRFAESEAYLRELGALDETSRWVGKQVLIANYLQSTSNAIILAPHYCIVCRNGCDAIMGEVEAELQAPEVAPARIVEVVGNMTARDELMAEVPDVMVKQLQGIADERGGLVPIHGRLFAQWLHYMFPRECPYPHKVGRAKMTMPTEFAETIFVSAEDRKAHAALAAANRVPTSMTRDDLEWMSQWDHEEELVATHTLSVKQAWRSDGLLRCLGAFAFVATAAFSFALGVNQHSGSSGKSEPDTAPSSHVV